MSFAERDTVLLIIIAQRLTAHDGIGCDEPQSLKTRQSEVLHATLGPFENICGIPTGVSSFVSVVQPSRAEIREALVQHQNDTMFE